MLRPHAESPRITLAIVSLGGTAPLVDCIAALVSHETRHDFSIVWVSNDPGRLAVPTPVALPEGVREVHIDTNLGWSGGLHAARAVSNAELFVWVQDDMVVLPGWLDALVDAADAHPEFAAFGSRSVDEHGAPSGFAGGEVSEDFDVSHWNDTDTTGRETPTTVTRFEWITSKGLLTRVSAWDAVGGADPRLYPLHHVDKDYSVHLRAHGLSVALVPDARLLHLGSQSAPSSFRFFLRGWVEPAFNERWASVARELGHEDRVVAHECLPWAGHVDEAALALAMQSATDEAGKMLVPLARWFSRQLASSQDQLHAEQAGRAADREHYERFAALQLAEMQSSLSWRITAPVRALGRLRRRQR